MRPFLVVIALAVAGCQAHTQTTHQNYLKTWNDRLEGYREQYVQLDTQIRQGDKRIGEVIGASEIAWTNFASDFADLGVQIRDAYKIAGRGETLKRFLTHMESRPGHQDRAVDRGRFLDRPGDAGCSRGVVHHW